MATTTEQIKTDYPLPVYNYRVDIDADTISFSEVSGLEIAYETITYKESRINAAGSGPNIMYMPGMPKPLNITLKKGYVKGKSRQALYNWINETKLNRTVKKDIKVHLCDETGKSVVRWKVTDAFPIKLTAPNFSASTDEVAIESMELMASSLTMEEN